MKVLITGICGFVGSALARKIREQFPEWELVGIDNFSRAGSWLNKSRIQEELGVQFFHGDIRSTSDVDSLPSCDWVIDAAANPSVMAGVDGKTSSRQLVEHNLSGTINLLEYCKRHQAGFILLSTSRVYSIKPLANLEVKVSHSLPNDYRPLGVGLNRFHPQSFSDGLSAEGIRECFSTSPPVSVYGSTKVASEHLALEYGETFGFPVWINRCGVMAGAGQFAHPAQGIFAFWIHSFREERPLKYIGFDGLGRQVRDCLHPNDLVSLFGKQIREPLNTSKPRLLNFSGGSQSSTSLAELSAWCRKRFPSSTTGELLPLESKMLTEAPESRPFDLPWVVLDSSQAEEIWGWRPENKIADLCEQIACHAEEYSDWLVTTMK